MNKTAIINGKKINYKFIHTPRINRILVFLHDGLGSIKQWKKFPDLLHKELNVPYMAYDRYGYGESDKLSEKRKLNFLETEAKEFLKGLLDASEISGKLILFGHSDGATLALMFASYFPEKVEAVIAEAPHVIIEEESARGLINTIKMYETDISFREKLQKYHGKKTGLVFYGWADVWTSEGAMEWNMVDELKNITSPVLIIQGSEDEYGTYEQLNTVRENISGYYDELFIDGCGHAPHLQIPELVINKVKEFLWKIKK